MRYVVWINECGYYKSYKSKVATTYTNNRHYAFEYKTLHTALTRLGVSVDENSVDDFIKRNIEYDKVAQREKKLSKLMKTKDDIDISFVILSKGRIEKVDEDGSFIEDATDEVVKFIEGKLEENKKKYEVHISKFNRLMGGTSYVEECDDNDDFWDGF
jgi:hypothetical protein